MAGDKADHAAASKSYIINIVRPGTITLKTALPDLKRNITINGLGASDTTVRRDSRPATPGFRVFTVDAGKTVRISGLTIAGGKASGTGGGLDNSRTLTVSDCVFSGNSAGGSRGAGGGLNNIGTATVSDCVFSGNSAGGFGGGISGLEGLIQSGNTFTGNSPDDFSH